jgi:Ca2+-binding EF-hand superfamily protein
MFDFLKKFFGFSSSTKSTEAAPYKVEAPVNDQITDAVTQQPSWHTAPPSDTKPVTAVDALDVNRDGKVDINDVKEAVKKTSARVKKAADVDGDGKVTIKDAKAAVKKAAPKRGRKPKAK